MTRDLEHRFRRFVQRKLLARPGERVLIAVSGGVDSVVLLHLFKQTAAQLRVEIEAAHFDHAIREASAADAEWVAGLCEAWGIRLWQARSPVELPSEAAARQARYRFLALTAQRTGAHRIATAHHADDQVETVIFRVLRGTGMSGLAGIPLRRGRIIRPLLRFTKAEIQEYAATHRLSFREDETNSTERYARNRIRRAVLPILQTVNPAAPRAILALARHAARTERAWRSIVEDALERVVLPSEKRDIELARDILLEYDAEIRARVLRALLRRVGVVPEKRTLRQLLHFIKQARSGSHFDVNGVIRVERAYQALRITRAPEQYAEGDVHIAECGAGTAAFEASGIEWQVRWVTSQDEAPGEVGRFDCAALQFPLTLRTWRPGDRMQLSYGTKKLKKLFAEHRIPFHARAAVPILVDGTGRVLWVVGVARSEDALARSDAPALSITVKHVEIS